MHVLSAPPGPASITASQVLNGTSVPVGSVSASASGLSALPRPDLNDFRRLPQSSASVLSQLGGWSTAICVLGSPEHSVRANAPPDDVRSSRMALGPVLPGGTPVRSPRHLPYTLGTLDGLDAQSRPKPVAAGEVWYELIADHVPKPLLCVCGQSLQIPAEAFVPFVRGHTYEISRSRAERNSSVESK